MPDGWTGAFALAGAGVLVTVARSGGVGWDYLGLDSNHLGQGIKVGLVGAGVVAAGVLAAVALPFSREGFADDRFVGVGIGEMLYESLVRIPLGTALTEEIAFRGVLLGLLLMWFSPLKATLVAAALFGLWHVLPGLDALETNPAGDIGQGWLITTAGVAVQVAATAAAGMAFTWLRFRGRSLAAPFLVHWGLNASAYVAGWLVVRNSWA
ncbi:MAG: CPBP family intramembrane metalloprotease [bacterium]|nr:CPBP family intramembrane metalloprotease [bacterium]